MRSRRTRRSRRTPSRRRGTISSARGRSARGRRARVLADDSGLEVLALGGAPGVHSKRWSGARARGPGARRREQREAGRAALQRATDRCARYVCVAAIKSTRREMHARGECGGVILETPRGDDGFGYDPYFFSDELRKTFGEATRAEKEGGEPSGAGGGGGARAVSRSRAGNELAVSCWLVTRFMVRPLIRAMRSRIERITFVTNQPRTIDSSYVSHLSSLC